MRNALKGLCAGLIFAVTPAVHASPVYDFTAVDYFSANPANPIYFYATFSLTGGQAPNFVGGPPTSLTYDNVSVTFDETDNGTVTQQLQSLATVQFFSDGAQVKANGAPGGFTGFDNFFAGAGSGIWSGNPNSPTFNPGTYLSSVELGDMVQVEAGVSPIPEPASFVLLGTGVLGLVGLTMRRRLGLIKQVA